MHSQTAIFKFYLYGYNLASEPALFHRLLGFHVAIQRKGIEFINTQVIFFSQHFCPHKLIKLHTGVAL